MLEYQIFQPLFLAQQMAILFNKLQSKTVSEQRPIQY